MPPDFVDLAEFIPGLAVDLRYATTRNFTGQVLYESPRAWLQSPVALRLAAAADALKARGWGLKVWDAYRPLAAHRRLWEACPNPEFIAPPERGSRHSRGAAVDLTLMSLDRGTEAAMGTDFDDFTPAAAPDYPGLPQPIRQRRQLLRAVMVEYGFTGIRSEWWHFDAVGWERYPVVEHL